MLHRLSVLLLASCGIVVCASHSSRAADSVKPTLGPYVRHVNRDTVEVAWETGQAVPTVLEHYLGTRAKVERTENPAATTKHRATIRGVLPERVYSYRILLPNAAGKVVPSETYTFDSTYDFTTPKENEREPPSIAGETPAILGEYAEQVAKHAGTDKGVCLVIGSAGGRLAYEIASRTSLQIVVVESDERAAAVARRLLDDAGYYGARATVHVGPLDKLPYADYMANVIVSNPLLDAARLPSVAKEWQRVLRPSGGVVLLGDSYPKDPQAAREKKLRDWFAEWHGGELRFANTEKCVWAVYRRGDLQGAGDWTHQYGGADNASCSQDGLAHGDLRPLWFGQPGPRPMPDRGGRNPAPLAAAGNLFVQGDRILFGLDAYNGTVRWVYQIPDLRRANIPRDSSNMAAGRDTLHVALGAAVMNIDAITGKFRSTYAVAAPDGGATRHEWGYIARIGETLLGSAVPEHASFLADRGEWYDGPPGWETDKVVSDNLFALDAASGVKRWEYRGGRILNSTIAVADGRAFFVETRSKRTKKKPGRAGDEALAETYLIALDLATGKPVWESPTDLGTGRRVVYLAHQNGTLVLSGSSEDYVVRTFDAATGASGWQKSFPWKQDHHGGAIQHPVLVGGTVYTEFKAFGLADGADRPGLPPRGHGCGAQTASQHAFFYRGGYHTTWDIATGKQTEMAPARSGCWLGIIPAGGIVLAPETSSGCSCTHALQTSMAFVPRRVQGNVAPTKAKLEPLQ